MKQQNHFFVSNKKAFTLLEVLISVSILVLVFVFLYSQFNLAQLSTKKTTTIEKHATKRAKIVELFYNDFLTSKDINPTSGKKYDKFTQAFSSKNSLYGITQPYIKYAVVTTNEGNQLIRAEGSTNSIDLKNANSQFYIDTVVQNVKFFKVIQNNDYIEFFLQVEGMKDIYFKLKRFYK